MKGQPSYYSHKEEQLNVISHALGFLLSVLATILLLRKAWFLANSSVTISAIIYAFSMLVLYGASTLYHYTKTKVLRYKLNILDHAAIYILIAGTYTPFTLITLRDSYGYLLFAVVWSLALVGVILKLFYTGKFKLLSTIMYVLMGWLVVFAIKPLINNLAINGVYFLFAGGLSYTIGAILFMFDKLKFNHAVFHVFVLLGSILHFLSIYLYVIK